MPALQDSIKKRSPNPRIITGIAHYGHLVVVGHWRSWAGGSWAQEAMHS